MNTMQSTRNPILHVFPNLMRLTPISGYVHPFIVEVCKIPQIFLKILPFVWIPYGSLLVIFFNDSVIQFFWSIADKKMGEVIKNLLFMNNCGTCFQKIVLTIIHRDEITLCLKTFDRSIKHFSKDPRKMKLVRVTGAAVAKILAVYITTASVEILFFEIQYYFVFGKGQPSAIPTQNNEFLLTYTLSVALSFVTVQTSFNWLMVTSLAFISCCLIIGRRELQEIFSILSCDESGNVFFNETLYNTVNTHENRQEPISVLLSDLAKSKKSQCPMYNDADDIKNTMTKSNVKPFQKLTEKQISDINRTLNQWIDRHNDQISCSNILNQTYSAILVGNYMYCSIMVAALVFFDKNMEGKHPLSLAIYSLISIGLLYICCKHGDQLIETSQSIADDAYECCWYLYPISIQKKLLFIILISHNKVLALSMYGLNPFSKETFYSVIQLSYSFFTVIQNVEIN